MCFSASQLLDIFVLDPFLPISRDHFRHICPAIVQQLLGDACKPPQVIARKSAPSDIESKTHYLLQTCYFDTVHCSLNKIQVYFSSNL